MPPERPPGAFEDVKRPESVVEAKVRVGITAATMPVRPLRRLRPDWFGT